MINDNWLGKDDFEYSKFYSPNSNMWRTLGWFSRFQLYLEVMKVLGPLICALLAVETLANSVETKGGVKMTDFSALCNFIWIVQTIFWKENFFQRNWMKVFSVFKDFLLKYPVCLKPAFNFNKKFRMSP